jgi:hypothetical protein
VALVEAVSQVDCGTLMRTSLPSYGGMCRTKREGKVVEVVSGVKGTSEDERGMDGSPLYGTDCYRQS